MIKVYGCDACSCADSEEFVLRRVWVFQRTCRGLAVASSRFRRIIGEVRRLDPDAKVCYHFGQDDVQIRLLLRDTSRLSAIVDVANSHRDDAQIGYVFEAIAESLVGEPGLCADHPLRALCANA